MKPAPFAYRDPRTLDETLALLAEHGDACALLAGGQSLVPLMNLRLAQPDVVVDLNRLPGLDGVDVNATAVTLGALVRASAAERHHVAGLALPVLRSALRHVGHPQIRNRTTIGGNLAHADPASELPALLAALDGRVTLASLRGRRALGWQEFFLGPLMTDRAPDEMLVAAHLPVPAGIRMRFDEYARRPGDFAVVGVCVGLRRERGVVGEARVALSGVAGTPVRLPAAEAALAGVTVDQHSLTAVGEIVRSSLDPPDDIHAPAAYRRQVAAVLVSRALTALWEEEAV